MTNFTKTNQNNKILNKLISENCLSFGRSPKLNNRKITHYISGARQKVDIFNLYEMRYLLLKVYPLIHNLFLQERLNVKKKKWTFDKNSVSQNNPQTFLKQFLNLEKLKLLKTKLNKPLLRSSRPFLPKILFATTTEIYSEIIISAATKCHMPFHINRWLSGTITASASYLDDFEKWSFLTNDFQENINDSIRKKFFKHKKNVAQQEKRIRKYQLGRKPSLIIIPDISNNEMIIKETNAFGIPVLGIVNSNCSNEIAYPIFANDFSIYSIHFFCHFLSSLITKEIVKNKHKIKIIPKKKINRQLPQVLKEIFNFSSRVSKMKLRKKKQGLKEQEEKFVFKGRYFVDNFIKPKIRIKKQMKYAKEYHLRDKAKQRLITPKKLILIENQKRWETKSFHFYLKKNILSKIKLIKKLHRFNFAKIARQIRIPKNKPKFRFWNKSKFFFSRTLKFSQNTNLAFQVQTFGIRRFFRNSLKKIKIQNQRKKFIQKRNQKRNQRRNKKPEMSYRKKWI